MPAERRELFSSRHGVTRTFIRRIMCELQVNLSCTRGNKLRVRMKGVNAHYEIY